MTRLFGIAALAALLAAPAVAANGQIRTANDPIRPAVGPPIFTGWRGATLTSSNWAGYAVTSPDPSNPASFTNVSATWKEPATTCGENDGQGQAAFWIGIGGYHAGSQALEQIGTMAGCDVAGPTSYVAWYELVPGPALSFAMQILPGDTVSASVSISTTNIVTMELKNLTRHTTAYVRQKDTSPDLSSAEWIAEAPTLCDTAECDVTALPDFNSIAMSKVQATAAGSQPGTITNPAWQATPIQIASDGSTAGTCAPTGLAGNGGAFTVNWNAAPQPGC
jgi:hypothetical protein